MKIKTKLKILRWVEKLIKWNRYDGMYPIITKKEIQIQTVSVCHFYSNREIKMISRSQIDFALKLKLFDELDNIKIIEYAQTPDELRDGIIVTAKLKVILP